ncbi:hypothetical protein H1P_2910008 [Hyella patelloides LEGE 07179]|uniref:Uncharacterized protein n=1 Tax=Hyella patelloides LEGE 07179 TaxID=945734 RepID=A0A563VTS2_9CYAN|nr:hypothetical protein [Hyella patelloides]VEP14847.1 hypothetical protein H1P_2910008 [Hyella patelloides LEGE 07179]
MIDIPVEKNSEEEQSTTEQLKEYKLLTELSEDQRLEMELIAEIRHASDRKNKSRLIEEAANKLEKSTRTIRRMVTKVEQEGLAALCSTVRSDRG